MSTLLESPMVLAGWLLCACTLFYSVFAFAGYLRNQKLITAKFQKENLVLENNLRLLQEQREKTTLTGTGWEGFANFVVARKVKHGDSNICSFYLKPRDERLKLAPYLPGQHLVFQLPVSGSPQPITRRYSLSDRPNDEYYRVSVKLQGPPLDKPSVPFGLGSSYFHQQLHDQEIEGDLCLIQVSSPAGSFVLDPYDPKPVVLIGAGVGVTPIISMFNSILEENESREVWFFYTVRNTSESIIFDEGMLHPDFETLVKNRGNIHTHVFYSKPAGTDSAEIEGVWDHNGRLTVEELKKILPSNNYQFFICGPEGMMDQFEEELALWGVPEEDILSERFQPPTKKAHSTAANGMVKFSKSGKEAEFSDEDGTLLDLAERMEIPIAFDCRAGSCGRCKVSVVSGKVSYNIRTNYKCPPGSCLACSCVPDGDVELDC